MFSVKIVTEMHEVITYSIDSVDDVFSVVGEWLLTHETGETPVYSIEITPSS